MDIQPTRTLALALGLALAPAALAADAGTPPAVDPAAIAALQKMGTTLRGLKQFSVESDANIDVVLENGQKVEIDQAIHYRVHAPDRLRVDLQNAHLDRQVYFDNGKLTLWAPRKHYYATVDTEARTLGQLVANASEKYDVELPLTDLFLWGTAAAPASAITAAFKVGDSLMEGDHVDHWALRQEGVDWQVWISQATSLPRKLVITSLDDPAQPEFSAELHWDTKTPIDDAVFAFQPPAGASRIELVPAVAIVEEEK